MVTFEESKMVFSFPEDDVYRIEKSSLLADVELKATECVVCKDAFYNAVMLRHGDQNLPKNVKDIELMNVGYSFILVIYGHKLEWLPPLMDALKHRMRHTLKLWNISDVKVKVMNDEMALANHIIVETK